MATPTVLLIGCGRMGKGIARMLLWEQQQQQLPFDLWIFDPYLAAESQCSQEVQECKIQGRLRSLRELFSKSESYQLSCTQPKMKSIQMKKASQLVSKAVKQITPQLILNAATYSAHQMYIPLARELGCDYLDLGQNLPPIQELNTLDATIAKRKGGTRIIQENGLAPGLANILAMSMYQKAWGEASGERIYSVQMRVGGLPQHTSKGGKLHYGPTFSPMGLLFEYDQIAFGLRSGKLVTPTTFSHPEYWESPADKPLPFGITPFTITEPKLQSVLNDRVEAKFLQERNGELILRNLEARPTADGTSRMCFDSQLQSTILNLEYKTLRYFPHYKTWKELQQRGRLSSMLAHWKQHMDDPDISGYPDLIFFRVWAQATMSAKPHTIELVALHDDVPVGSPMGFTAMQHLTGWPTVLLALTMLRYPPNNDSSPQPDCFLALNSKTIFGRTIKEVLHDGGIIAPFELIDGLPFLKEIGRKNRIPLLQTIISNNNEA